MQLTKEGLLKALRAQGLPETATDLSAVEKWLTDNPRRLVFDGKDVDLKAVFAPVVTLEPEKKDKKDDDPEPVIQLEEKVAAMVADALAKAGGRKPGDGAPPKTVNLDGQDDPDGRLSPEDVKVKSLEQSWKSGAPSGEKRIFDTHERAYGFGCLIVGGVLAGSPFIKGELVADAREKYQKWLSRQKGQYMTFPTAAGGALTGTQFATDIFEQLREYGVAMRECEVVEMTDTQWIGPTSDGDLDVYFPDEGNAPSTTKDTLGNITLNAKKAMTIVKMSREINADAIANLGDHVARKLARAFAKKVDDCVFNGDGTKASYGRMRGVLHYFGSSATSDARSVTGGDTTPTHTRNNLIEVIAKLVHGRDNAKWYGAPEKLAMVFTGLGLAQSGSPASEFDGRATYTATGLGRPLVPVNVMNTNMNTGGDVVDILYGDLRQAVIIGRRQDLTIEMSDQRYWDEHNLGIKGVMRFDTKVRAIGSSSEAGSLIALYQT